MRARRPPFAAPAKPAAAGPPAMPAPAPVQGTPAAQPGDRAGALLISLGPDEYLAAGSGPVTVAFRPKSPGAPNAGILSIEEGVFTDGRWVPGRRLNGDENGQGRFLRLRGDASRNGSIQRVRLYRYR